MNDDRPGPDSAEPSRPRPHSAEPSRPRPQYGEYATPEEQRARIRVPDASASLAVGVAPTVAATATRPSAADRAAMAAPRSLADRIATIGLLGLGLYNVVTAIPQFVDYPAFVQRFLTAQGIDATFTNIAQGTLWGVVAAVLFAAMWLATAIWSYVRLRHGRLAFWVPIVGAVVAGIAVSFCLAVPLVNDPAILGVLAPTHTPAP